MRSLCLVLSAVLLWSCATDDRERLVIYSPHGKEMLSYYEDAFEAEHPTIDVQWIDMGGQDAYDRIRTERVNPQASLWWGGDSPTFDRAAREDLLASYQPSWAEALPEGSFGASYTWTGTYFTPEVLTYNTEAFAGKQLPQTWDDLLDPSYADRILIRYPLASSTMRTIYGAMILRQPTVEEGYAWLARLDKNVKTYTADPTQLYLKLARGEGDVSMWNMPDTYIQSVINGYPFDYVLPMDGTPVLTDGIALVNNGPAQEAAKLFYEFVTTPEALLYQAETYFRIPVRTDIPRESLPDWITRKTIVPMDVDWERLATEGPTWMQYWDENIKGRGAAYLEEQGLE